jgi:hypothetical protein
VVNQCSYNWVVGKISGVTRFYRQHDEGVVWFLTWNYGKLEYFGAGSPCGAASLHTSWLMQQKPFTFLQQIDEGILVGASINNEGRKIEIKVHCGLLGADGARSTVHALAGISLEGERDLLKLVNVHFRSRDLGRNLSSQRPGMLFFIFNPDTIGVLIAHDLKNGEFVLQVLVYPPQWMFEEFSAKVCEHIIVNFLSPWPSFSCSCYQMEISLHAVLWTCQMLVTPISRISHELITNHWNNSLVPYYLGSVIYGACQLSLNKDGGAGKNLYIITTVLFQLEVLLHITVFCEVSAVSNKFITFPWNPGVSKVLHRLGGKPKLKKVIWLIVAPDCYFIQHNERVHIIFYGFDLLSLQHFHGHFIEADMFAPWDGQELTQFRFSELPIYWQQSHGEFFSASIIRKFRFILQLILLAITGMNSLLFFRKLKYSSSVEIFCGAQFSFPNILLSKSWSQKLATNTERQLLPEMLEVVNGYNCHELHLILTFIGVTHMISCGKYLIWIIGLLTPWDPGKVVFDLKFLMLWLEGKPNLKKGECQY